MNQSLMFRFALILFCVSAFYPKSTIADEKDIKRAQEYVKSKGYKWKAGENPVSVLPLQQRLQKRGLIVPTKALGYTKMQPKKGLKSLAAPAAIDWRALGGVTPPKDQGYCGSCWAFALAGNLESALLINPEIAILTDLSEQQLIDCNYYGMGCFGGWFDAFDVFVDYGAVTESDYPYVAYQSSCEQESYIPVATVETAYYYSLEPPIDATDIENIKTALNDYGPLFTSMIANPSTFDSYIGNLYEDDTAYCRQTGIEDLNHAVLLVGYDDNVPTTHGTGVWYIKNSWGTSWGDGGYMTAAYYDSTGGPTCQIGSFSGSIYNPAVPENNPPEITSGPVVPEENVNGGEEVSIRVTVTDPDPWDSSLSVEWTTTEGCGIFINQSNPVKYVAPILDEESQCAITATVTDQFGEEDSSSSNVTVNPNYAPELKILADKLEGQVPLKVKFAVKASDPNEGDTIQSYSWDFGDGQTSDEETCTHTFSTTDKFIVKLTATDSLGKAGTAYATINVRSGNTMKGGCGAVTDGKALNKLLFILFLIPIIAFIKKKIR